MIQIHHLTKRYQDMLIYEDTSYTFPNTGLVCLLGPSGCGKSTLFNLIAGFDDDYEGSIVYQGHDLKSLSTEEICDYRKNNIGFVFQNYCLIGKYSALENILLASDLFEEQEIAKPKAIKLLTQLGLADKINTKVENLSGGEKQRVAIARALINNPTIIMADEPTGALDRKNADEIMSIFQSLSKSHLVIYITHDMKCSEYADEIIRINDHQIIGEKHEETIVEINRVEQNKKVNIVKRAYKNFQIHFKRMLLISLAMTCSMLCFIGTLSMNKNLEFSIHEFKEKNIAYNNGYVKVQDNENEIISFLKQNELCENVYLEYVLHDITLKMVEKEIVIEEDYPMPKAKEIMSYGRMPKKGTNEIAISPSLASKFSDNIQDLISQSLQLNIHNQTYSLTVSGIFNASYDDIYLSSDIEEEIYRNYSDYPYAINYDVRNFEDIITINEQFKNMNVESLDASKEVQTFLDTFKQLSTIFKIVSFIVLISGIFITFILLIKQQKTRYNEVGLLSALGYRKENIKKILSLECYMLMSLTVVTGCISILLLLLFNLIFKWNLIFTISSCVVSIFICALTFLIISNLTSYQIIKCSPSIALRK